MKGILTAVAAAILLTTGNAHAVYKCNFAGRVVISQAPCRPNAKEVEIKIKEPTRSPKQERLDKAHKGETSKLGR